MVLVLVFLALVAAVILKLLARPALALAAFLAFGVWSYASLRQAAPPAAEAPNRAVKASGKAARTAKPLSSTAIF